jgi:hypothetical protein
MRLNSSFFKALPAALIVAFVASGCGKKNDKEAIVGIWQMKDCRVNGNEIGDGKGYMHFRADDSVFTRTGPGMLSGGKYSISPEEKKIFMLRGTNKVPYSYEWVGDTLVMRTATDAPNKLEMRTFKVDKLPVEPGSEKNQGPKISPR